MLSLPLWFFFSVALSLVLSYLLGELFTSYFSSSCKVLTGCENPQTPCVAPTGPTGLNKSNQTGSTGATGPTGFPGKAGLSPTVDQYGFFNESTVQQIQLLSSPFYFAITTDLRSNFLNPASLQGNKSYHLVLWNGSTWLDQGLFFGDQGATGMMGPTGAIGETGSTGYPSSTGQTGPSTNIGFLGPTGLTQTQQPTGSSFGDGRDGNLTVLAGQTVTLNKDMFYRTVNVQANGTLLPHGYRIFAHTIFNNDGLISNNGQTGGSDANESKLPLFGFGGDSGTMYGGGRGAFTLQTQSTGGTGGPSQYCLSSGFSGDLFQGSAFPGSWGGVVQYNSKFHNISLIQKLSDPLQGPTGFLIPVSGGSGGGAAAQPGFVHAGGGGGGGCIFLSSPLFTGNGTIEAKGGDAGSNATVLKDPAGGGGGGFIGIRTIAALPPYTLSVAGGKGTDATQVSGENPLTKGKDGLIVII